MLTQEEALKNMRKQKTTKKRKKKKVIYNNLVKNLIPKQYNNS